MLLEASPDAQAELLSQYVKFTTTAAPNGPAYAVVWLKSSKRLIVGLALPEAYEAEGLGAPAKDHLPGADQLLCGRGRAARRRAGWQRLGRHGLPEHAFGRCAVKRGGDSCLPSKPDPYRHRPSGMAVTPSMKGEVIYLYAYDVAYEADLAAIAKTMRGGAERFRLGRPKTPPAIFRLSPADRADRGPAAGRPGGADGPFRVRRVLRRRAISVKSAPVRTAARWIWSSSATSGSRMARRWTIA